MSKILCTICARGGSKGVKDKNIKLLNGLPLISHTILQAIESGLFDKIVVSTDSDSIAEVARKYGAEVFFKRDHKLSDDNAGKLEVIKDAFTRSEKQFNQKFDYLVDLDATSPLRLSSDIIAAFDYFCSKGGIGNLFSVNASHKNPYFNIIELDNNGYAQISKSLNSEGMVMSRQAAPQTYDINGSIYIWDRETLLNNSTIFLKNTLAYSMPVERSVDIDTILDFQFVEYLMNDKR